MELDLISYFSVALASFFAALLTLFSGFGLGTLLMPVIALFFPLDIAILITAIVHLLNNAFKGAMLGKNANLGVIIRFGIPALLFSILGAWLLLSLSSLNHIISYQVFAIKFNSSLIQIAVGSLILAFVVIDLWPSLIRGNFGKNALPLGGALSGFFGGLSGHQGAFRSLFLLKLGLDKSQFVATGVMLAIIVDLARLSIYGFSHTNSEAASVDWTLVSLACISAFIGSYIGAKLIKKITIVFIQRLVAALLIIIAILMITGAI